MATFTDALDVDVGDATKASDYDNLADNTEFNRETANVDHNFDITTGDGYHRSIIRHSGSINASVSLDGDYNYLSVSPVTIETGITVTVPTTGTWHIL